MLFLLAYRFGFNGYEKDDEISGSGNYLDFDGYGYDPRIGRRGNLDPLWKIFPFQSPYVYALNNPIRFMDVDGEGPGDGTMKLYVVKTVIRTTKGPRTVYLKKRYYENATPAQVKKYKANAITTNDWYFATENEYKAFQRNPTQGEFQSKTFGADTPEKFRQLGDAQGSPFGQRIDLKSESERSGKVNISTSGVDSEDKELTEIFTLSVLDAEGNVLSSESKTVTGKADISFDLNLKEGQSIMLNRTGGSTETTVNASTPAKAGEARVDNMSAYGTEMPTLQDQQEIGAKLEEQKIIKR